MMSKPASAGVPPLDVLAIRAEQALLGAVLLDPAGQQQWLDLVEPADFRRPWHAQVLAAMRRVQSAGRLPGPLEVYPELQNDPDLPKIVARDAVLLADLMDAVPRPAHAPAYAAMVAERGIRLRLELAGSRLAQTASTGDLDDTAHVVWQARREVAACRARWLSLPAALRPEPPAPSSGGGRNPGPAGPDRKAPEPARDQQQPGDPAAVGAGSRALRDLIAGPSRITEVRGWLRPEHFAAPGHGELYSIVRDLDTERRPVDPVTVSWEAARRGYSADPAALAGGTGAFAYASAREVRRLSQLAHAARAGHELQASAADPRQPPGQLLGLAARRLAALDTEPQPQPSPGRPERPAAHGIEAAR